MIAFVTLLLAAQAPAADAHYRCIVDPLSPTERAQLSQSAQNGGAMSAEVEARLQAVVGGCVKNYGWDPDRAGAMTVRALSQLLVEDVGSILAEQGIAPERIERWLARQDSDLQTRMEISETQGEQLIQALNAEGVPMPLLEANGHRIGAYLAALVMINRVNRNLPVL